MDDAVVERLAATLRVPVSIPTRNKYLYGLQLFRVLLFVYVTLNVCQDPHDSGQKSSSVGKNKKQNIRSFFLRKTLE